MQEKSGSAQRMPVIFDVTALVKQNVSSWRSDCHARSSYVIKNLGILTLLSGMFEAFGFKGLQERPGRLKFFEFLNQIPISENYPTIFFEGDKLPPIMAGWALGKIGSIQAKNIAAAYIDTQDLSDNIKKFYHTLIYVTFEPDIMEQTIYIDPDALEIVEKFKTCAYPLYLIGHCDRESYGRLYTRWAHLMDKFDRILFSHQIEGITSETIFDDAFWLHHLDISDQQDYVVVDDWTGPGKRGDEPPHYASTSRELAKMLQ
jgi:hypothetical protein